MFKVLYRDEGQLTLKTCSLVAVDGKRVLLESQSGDRRVHVIAHESWTELELEALIISSINDETIDLERISKPAT